MSGMHELHPPKGVLEIARRLEDAGHETWCVGGAIRDALLGLPHLDWDLATAATPDQVRQLFGRGRTIPVGVEFGTVGVLDRDGVMHEVTTFRRDLVTDGRHAVVAFGASLDDDLARRDFTINAIAYSPSRRALHDPFGGREDLARGLVRAVGEPAERMKEDRLRALRAIRFAARLGFEIDPATWTAIVDSAPYLGRLSPERVKQELEKTMEQVRAPARALRLWRDSGALATLVPPLADGPEEQLAALDCLAQPGPAGRPGRRVLRLAALFLHLTPAEAERALRDLRFSKHDIAWVGALVDRWRRLEPEMAAVLSGGDAPDDATLRRWVAAIERTRVHAFFRLLSAVWAARRAGGRAAPPARAVRMLYRRALRSAFRDALAVADLAVNGDDLRRAGIPAGPILGKILHALLDVVLADPPANTPERLLELAREWLARNGGPPPERRGPSTER